MDKSMQAKAKLIFGNMHTARKQMVNFGISFDHITDPKISRDEKLRLIMRLNHYLDKILIQDSSSENLSKFADPFLLDFRNQLLQNPNSILNWSKTPEKLINELDENLRQQIMELSYRTLIFKINETRKNRKFVSQDPKDQYLEFVNLFLGQKEFYNSMVNHFPILFKKIYQRISDYTRYLEFISSSIKSDSGELSQKFGIDKFLIKHMHIGLGDRHNGGRMTVKIELEGGISLIFKPHSLYTDILYNTLVSLYNQTNPIPLHQELVISKKDHGWTEAFQQSDYKQEREVQQFYYKMESVKYLV